MRLRAALDQRRAHHLLRELRPIDSVTADGTEIIRQGQSILQFSSNNYLGLATHPEVIAAARGAAERFGAGSGASRLVSGSLALHHELESALARFKGTEAALLFPTGFMANLAVLTTFAGKSDRIVSDKLNHASLLDAAHYSGAAHRTFPHRRYARAADLLSRSTAGGETRDATRFLVTDSVFSMDGDLADLPAACAAAESTGALVILDEAHGTGVIGPRGAGVAELQGVESRIALTIGTLSKALGSLGGFVAGPRAAIDTLVNHARGFIYTTALPPACAAAALAALHIVIREPERRQRLLRIAHQVRTELTAMGFHCGDSASPIIPVMFWDSAAALCAAESLAARDIFLPAIRPPTVPPHSARLRISLMATHTDAHIERLLTAMRSLEVPKKRPPHSGAS